MNLRRRRENGDTYVELSDLLFYIGCIAQQYRDKGLDEKEQDLENTSKCLQDLYLRDED